MTGTKIIQSGETNGATIADASHSHTHTTHPAQTDTANQFVRGLVATMQRDGYTLIKDATTGDQLAQILSRERIDINEDIPEDVPCLVVEIGGQKFTFGTLGNFSVLIGRAKGGKTTSLRFFIAAAIAPVAVDLLHATFPEGKRKVLWFDTEMGRRHVHKGLKQAYALAGSPANPDVECYALRKYNPKDKLELIQHAIYNTPGVGLVVIDGIRDLIHDINSPAEATEIAALLLRWTEERQIHILTILHQNKNDANARGHVGTELVNKAETVAAVNKDDKDNNLFIVEPEYCRERDFPAFAFRYGENNLPAIMPDWTAETPIQQRRNITAFDVAPETHIKVLRELFADQQPKKYKDLENSLSVKFLAYDVRLTQRATVLFITWYKDNGYLKDTGGKGRQGNSYTLGPKSL
jgi:hypothetical protein